MPRTLFREGRRLFLRAMHLLGTRTVFFVCLLLAVTTAISTARSMWFSFSGQVAQGQVVREIEELTADWSGPGLGIAKAPVQTATATRVYRAVVRFQDGERDYDVTAQRQSPARLYAMGSKVDVVYPRGAPERAKLRPELPDFWSQAGVLLMATVLGAGTAYGWWNSARKRAARRRRVDNTAA